MTETADQGTYTEGTEMDFAKYFYPSLRSCKVHEHGRHGYAGMFIFLKSKIKSQLHGGLFFSISYYVLSIFYCSKCV